MLREREGNHTIRIPIDSHHPHQLLSWPLHPGISDEGLVSDFFNIWMVEYFMFKVARGSTGLEGSGRVA